MARKIKKLEEPKGYNGWKNYETWAVALWIDNEEPSYRHARRMARAAKEESEEHKAEIAERGSRILGVPREPRGILADMLKEWAEEQMPNIGASMWSDLLNAAFGEVDWYEIAAAILSE